MILEVCADSREVDDHVDAERLEEAGRTDAAELQDARRVDGPCGQDDLSRVDNPRTKAVSTLNLDASRLLAVKHDGGSVVPDEQVQVLAVAHGVVIGGFCGRPGGVVAAGILGKPRDSDVVAVCAIGEDRDAEVLRPGLGLRFCQPSQLFRCRLGSQRAEGKVRGDR